MLSDRLELKVSWSTPAGCSELGLDWRRGLILVEEELANVMRGGKIGTGEGKEEQKGEEDGEG